MTSRPFNPTSSKSLNQLHSDNDIESSKENPHRLHDRRSRSPSRTPIDRRNQDSDVSWFHRFTMFVEVNLWKISLPIYCLQLVCFLFILVNTSPVAQRLISITFDKACEFYSSVKTDLYTVIETFNQLVGEIASWRNGLLSQLYRG